MHIETKHCSTCSCLIAVIAISCPAPKSWENFVAVKIPSLNNTYFLCSCYSFNILLSRFKAMESKMGP